MSQYIKKRKEFYSNYPHFWSDLYECEYSLFHVFPITEQTMKQLQVATERMGKIFFKTARLLRNVSNEQLLELGFPTASLPFIRLKGMYPESVISRFDFALTEDNRIKMLEFNSDTPTFIVECFQMNGKVCEELGYDDPNANQERLLSSGITKAVMEFTKGMEDPNVVFTAHPEHIEDWNTTMYLSGLCHVENKVMPMTELRITDDALVDRDGVPIDVLYRQTYPIEDLIEDQDPETGDLVGVELLQLVKEGKLFIINPLSAFLLQPKSIQCLIWGLAEEGAFYTSEEQKWIKEYMLPTYLEPDLFLGKSPFVQKPSFGREGDTITIRNKDTNIMIRNAHKTYKSSLPIFQKYTELPVVFLETEKGIEKLSYVFGAFLIAGKASSIGIRAGEKITGNESYYLPVGIKKEENK
ncbi:MULTISPECIES: glutathionylspermidine synthase family protein [Bacillus]|uniref:Glutathionylspermidine synthase n=2 Tax=Bacillus mycoides TaxID=1405 RepID=A9VMI6_BACMK|nr:glutathionylspermidine synthase family protein [Bacillus mycoides]EEL06968.1 Glutathionylspermidine synthase [Bacillus cereus BDRD-ST196]ABY42748.1 glutathionylspermidine synthase [Bacillus mycoides KBAB4]AIW86029.1 glutathionylspermidine synthase preATP-grasp family protein [Bacillus mycoides]MCQ6526664.1 glutathionylspermidine synthase family protein [Bacillus mycoides]MED1282295.1 glutathionylspermidine synthase family protein [Bacillus mycoides]